MNLNDSIKEEIKADIVPSLLESEIPNALTENRIVKNAEPDPLEDECLLDDDDANNPSASGFLTTNTAKFEYAQKIVKEVMKRVPIFTQSVEEEKKVADKLRLRMMRIKNRILNDIKLPLEAQAVARETAKKKRNSKYRRMLAKQTPEEAAQRRKREAEAKFYNRNIQKELVTPEVLLKRRNERLKKRLERKANETPEERAARKEQLRNYRQMLKERRTEKDAIPKPVEIVCAKTGIVYEKSKRKPRRKGNDLNKGDQNETDIIPTT